MTTTELTKPGHATDTSDNGITGTARKVADTVAGAAGEVTARFPDVAQGTRDAFSEANTMVRRGSDQTLKVVGASAIGIVIVGSVTAIGTNLDAIFNSVAGGFN